MPTPNEPQIQITKKGLRLKIDPKGFLGASVKIGFKKYASGIVDGIKALTIEKPKERIAFLLVFNSFINACRTLIQEASAEYKKVSNQGTKTKGLRVDTTKQLEELELVMTKDFFLKPNTFPFLHQFKPYLEAWLYESIGITLEKANEISRKLPNQFWEELDIEYRENRTEYETLETYFKETPFSKGLEHNRRLTQYYNELLAYYHEPTLNQANLKLSDLYIEPDFHIYEKHFDKKKKEDFKIENNFLIHQSDIDLHGYLGRLLDHQTPFGLKAEKAQLKLLLGQPGQGKTSFCYRVIHDYLNTPKYDKELFFLKLRRVTNPTNLINNPIQEIKRYFEQDKLNFDLDNCILILDGLDELYLSEGLKNSDIDNFFYRLINEVKNHPDSTVLITSRYHYIDLNKIDQDDALILSIAPLTTEKQINWLEKYKVNGGECTFSKKDIFQINNNLVGQFKELKELITQPILLALVVKANFKISTNVNRASIYNQLFKSLIERNWDKSGKLDKHRNFDKEDFRDYIGAIALKIYQSDNEYISKKTLLLLESTKEFIENNLAQKTDLEDSLKDVLITFYFQEVENEDNKRDYAIEFFHKSLQEFLVAERIYYSIKSNLLARKNDRRQSYYLNNWESTLKYIWDLVSPKVISHEVAEYLKEIIENDSNKEQKEKLVERMALFIPDLLDHQFLLDYSADRDQGNPVSMACTCFFVYWHILSLSSSNEMIKKLGLGVNFVSLLKINQIESYQRISLRGANLSEANLRGTDLFGADLRGADLRRADLLGANLLGADLIQANLIQANLIQVNLIQANLIQADLKGAYLKGVDLLGADLSEADFLGADLLGANLNKANLKGVNLKGADLSDSNLNKANLRGANLSHSNLSQVNLSQANLSQVNLSEADLSEADLSQVDLSQADLSQADLSQADLRQVNLRQVNLSEADLSEADLRGANLSKADLRGADLRGVDLSKADLRGADLRRTYLSEAYLRGAYLKGADLSEADLGKADLSEAYFWGADLRGANLKGAYFWGADLSEAYLRGAMNYTLKQLSETKSLKNCKGIKPEIESELKELKPELFK